MESIKNIEKPGILKKVLLFTLIIYAVSWFIWFFVDNVAIQLLGACAPSIVGFFFIRFSKSDIYKGYGKGMINFKLIHFNWYLVIILAIPAITVLALITNKLSGGAVTSLDPLLQNLGRPLTILFFVLWGLGAGFGEELGWRGFLLETLQKRWSNLMSSLIVGVIWALWHIPLSVINKVSIFSVDYMNYFIFVILLSVIFAVIYNNNNRSLLSAILFHAMVNATQYIFFMNTPVSTEVNILKTVYLLILVIGVLLICKRQTTVTKRIQVLS